MENVFVINVAARNFLLVLATLTTLASGAKADLVVVVNKRNSISNLSMIELKRIYLGKNTAYMNGEEIALAEYAQASEDFYRVALKMPIRKIRKHWMKVIFSGGNATPPKVFKMIKKVIQFVKETDGAICFVESSDVTDDIKVLTIDSKKPGNEDYPLALHPKPEQADPQAEGR